ncbi:MAG: Maf family protein [Methylocystaceae bacterium]
MPIILASASPRRYQLLQQVGLEFMVIPAEIKEDISASSPGKLAEILAAQKAEWVAGQYPQAVVIAADTIVVADERVLGKPADRDDARLMLRLLSGREHQVITGLSVQCLEQHFKKTVTEITKVLFRNLTDEEIETYLHSGEPFDKAGAYGIQGLGALFVERIEGCYFNVVGLPLNRLNQVLREAGINLLGR